MPITLRKTTKISITNSIIWNGKKEIAKELQKPQTVKIETKSNTVKVLR